MYGYDEQICLEQVRKILYNMQKKKCENITGQLKRLTVLCKIIYRKYFHKSLLEKNLSFDFIVYRGTEKLNHANYLCAHIS